jgi:hypothetical protein
MTKMTWWRRGGAFAWGLAAALAAAALVGLPGVAEAAVPEDPTHVMLSVMDSAATPQPLPLGTLRVEWMPPTGGNDTDLSHYQVQVRVYDASSETTGWTVPAKSVAVGAAKKEATFSGLNYKSNYQARVQKRNRSATNLTMEAGPWALSMLPPEKAGVVIANGVIKPSQPGKPLQIATPIVEAGDKMLAVSWTVPHSDLAITHYMVHHQAKDAASGTVVIVPVPSAQTAISGLKAATEYTVKVAAVSEKGAGLYSAEVKATTTGTATTTGGTGAAGAPVKIAMPTVMEGDMMLMVSWNAPASEKPILYYEVRHMAAGAAAWVTPTMKVTDMMAEIMKLTNGMAYVVQVRANNANGDGPWSESASGTPMGATPTPALPIFGAFALAAGLAVGGRRRLRQLAAARERRRLLT